MRNRIVGYMVLGFAALMAFIIYSFNTAMARIVEQACTHGSTCAMWETLGLQTNVSLAITAFVAAIGLYLIFFGKEEKTITKIIQKTVRPSKEDLEKKRKKVLAKLEGDEREVFSALVESKGSMLQSDLIEKTGMQKVKVTRVLDRMEGKKLIERKRRGMSNMVILKD